MTLDTTMTDLGEELVLPNGSGLYYVDKDHAYYLRKADGSRGRRLTSVTTVIKPVDFRPDNLMKWAAKQNGIGIAQLINEVTAIEDAEEMRGALEWATTAESIWSTLEQAKLTYDDVRTEAGRRGTNVHKRTLEALAKGEPTPDYAGLLPEDRNHSRAVVQWWLDNDMEPGSCLNVEQMVVSERLGVAGRFDLRAKIPGLDGPRLVDLKTSSFIGESAHVQLAGYDYVARECGIGGSVGQHVLQVFDDGSYRFIEGQATHEDFLAAVDLYRRAGRLQNAGRKAWAEAATGKAEAIADG